MLGAPRALTYVDGKVNSCHYSRARARPCDKHAGTVGNHAALDMRPVTKPTPISLPVNSCYATFSPSAATTSTTITLSATSTGHNPLARRRKKEKYLCNLRRTTEEILGWDRQRERTKKKRNKWLSERRRKERFGADSASFAARGENEAASRD